ncbi:hypothetical protein NUW58_g4771 [Xylaria curta]|uniref:Uncharacterized protein n=1 Tax=Xylaria curta TaxID=42375 RepID=A0ACC1P6L1_9PEZI|nr:hypothetical protein NUW58_g4771 [Xylaria curta]
MTPPEHFHSCHSCHKFEIDLTQRTPLFHPTGEKENIPSDIFFFDATLGDVLTGITNRCELCVWLDSLWKGPSSSSQEQYIILKAGENSSSIPVCAETYSMSLADRYPVDEILFFGLWETDAALHPHWGKCRVFAKCSVDVFTTQCDAASRLIRNRPVNRFPGSAASLELAHQWLGKCQSSHAKCRDFSPTYMPLRVLRIRNDCGPYDFHVTLETTTKNGLIEPFAALSYCWGGDQPYKTTRVRMQAGDVPLEWCRLPRSLQDAVKITAALGLQCLWADSLCIIQDDDEDKALQIADMARIYSQATVTIIASRASRAVDGFLGEIDLASQTKLAVRLRFRCPDDHRTVGSAYLTHIEGSRDRSEPIDSRAWTLQERYLSNRVLEFGSRQTRWTCATSSALTSPPGATNPNSSTATTTATASDSYTDGWKWDSNSDHYASQMLYLHVDLLADLVELAMQRSSAAWVRDWLHGRWQGVLAEYTPTAAVPCRTDRQDENEEYLAGMWKSSLPSFLCWHAVVTNGAEDPKQQGRMGARDRLPLSPEIYQGPSWSWTGVNCHVLFIFGRACDRDCRAVLLNANVTLANTAAKCGAVTHAALTLKGRMRRSSWDIENGTLHVNPNEEHRVGEEFGNAMSSNTMMRKVHLATVYPDTSDAPRRGSKVHGLQIPVWLFEIGNCVGLKKRGPVGLILEPVDVSLCQDPPRFRRLGLFHIDTRRAQETSQLTHHGIENMKLEDEMNFFEEQMVKTIQLE